MRVIGVEPDEAAEGLPADYWQACRLAEQGQFDAARRLYEQVDGGDSGSGDSGSGDSGPRETRTPRIAWLGGRLVPLACP
jgi:hypothetical protein